MKRWVAVLALVTFGVAAACAGGSPDRSAAPARPAAAALELRQVASDLEGPLHVAAPRSEPDRVYIVEQVGRIRVLEKGRLLDQPFLDIRNLVQSGGEQGLFSIAFHPRYAQNRRFYVQYTDVNGDTRIVEYRSSGTRALTGSRRQLFFQRDPYGNHNGGQLAFGPDGKLYGSVGDGGAGGDPEDRAQNMASLFGKLFTIDVDRAGAKPQVVALGLRNPWRFSFDRANGDLYIGDVGQNSREEIDYTPRRSPGLENYGWDVYEGSRRFEDKKPSRGRLVFPIAEYGRSDGYSVTGGFVYRGKAIPSFRGRYIYGDYGSGTIWSLRVVGGKATEKRRESIQVDELSSFGEDAAGELYATSLSGSVYRITG
jgi:glucose/arabinose dehydrogenase